MLTGSLDGLGGVRADAVGPTSSLRAGLAALRAGASWSARQPAALVVNTAFYVMVSGVLAAVWATATEAGGGEIVGYGTTAIVWYIVTTEASIMALPMRLIADIGDDIGTERVAIEMLRPASVVAVRIGGELGRMAPRLALNVLFGSIVALVTVGPPPAPRTLLLGLPALVLAVGVNVAMQHAFAAGAFWIRDAKASWFLYQKLLFILGGMLLPLEVLPPTLEAVTKALPLMAMAYAPARLVSGHWEPSLLAVQAGWLVVTGALAAAVFAAGQRHLVRGRDR